MSARGGASRCRPQPQPAPIGSQEFTVQVMMWNPQVFPQLPERTTHVLAVKVFPGGRVVAAPFGTSVDGMTMWAETDVDASGRKVLRFPFDIPGL